MIKKYLSVFLIGILHILSNTAESGILQEYNDLKGSLEQKGWRTEITYTGDYWANIQGGLDQGETYLGNLDVKLDVDTAKNGLWPDGRFFAYFLDDHGGKKLSKSLVGDLQTVSNIEAPRTTRLYELWYEHRFWDDSLFVLAGVHDHNSDFNVTEYGGLFINSSFGVTAEMAGARPSYFPLAAPGARIKWDIGPQWSVLAGAYDGDPDDPDDVGHFPRFDLDREGGALIASEIQHHYAAPLGTSLPGTLKIGGWHNTGKFNDVVDVNDKGNAIERSGHTGGYVIWDQAITRPKEDQGLNIFFQLGAARASLNEIDLYTGSGLTYRGIGPRVTDEIGIAIAYASINNDLADIEGREDHETALELTYKIVWGEQFVIQPDIQWIFNPNADENINNVFVAGLRFSLAL